MQCPLAFWWTPEECVYAAWEDWVWSDKAKVMFFPASAWPKCPLAPGGLFSGGGLAQQGIKGSAQPLGEWIEEEVKKEPQGDRE